MHALFRSCARSSSKAAFGFLLICVPLLLAQNTTVPVQANKELPDAPMPVTTASPTPSNLSFARPGLPLSFDTSRSQAQSWMGMSHAIERPTFNTNALASRESRPNGKDVKIGGRSPINWFALDPVGGHANRAA